MKRIIVCVVVLCCWCSMLSAAAHIAGSSLSEYVLVYNHLAEAEEGSAMAAEVQQMIADAYGRRLTVQDDAQPVPTKAIVLQHSEGLTPFQYKVCMDGHRLVIDAGGCWAMRSAAQQAVKKMSGRGIPRGYAIEGTVEGEVLFPREDDVELRILDDNIWEYNAETIPEAWQKAGLDCRDDWRAPQFAQLVRAYMPDVVLLQEYNRHMHERFYPLIQQYGYQIAWEPGEAWDNTPVFFRTDRLEMLESNFMLYTPERWSNHGTKSYTSAVFRHKVTGDTVACISTHLWWQSDKKTPGSTQARAAQVRLIMAEAEAIKAKYGCTLFLAGDLNSEEEKIPVQQLLEGGYVPCYRNAERRTDNQNGHHTCGPNSVGVRRSARLSAERQGGAIDHCFIYNAQPGARVLNFECLTPWFTVLLTDHYPNLIDARL